VKIEIPIKTVSASNAREHRMARHRRVAKERGDVALYLVAKHFPPPPLQVLLVRIAPSSGLDDDNLRGALKAVRDEVAKHIGVDDRDPRVTWAYDQRRGEYGVEVTIAVPRS
jgi:hypothetical protein